ncbi:MULTISPECIES: hypothetical protein [Staphylococcus]|uniref:DNA-binding protein n=1 Tax=Staphylococcus lugdunensis TaxID=28035 RepID=A0ABX6BTY4_STALU|nr:MULTISPECIES: hypothetical protein [Staphylococcus]ADC88541.1 hypothetical protein SLGD_02477 [Staphylococcus lugdunensis HKU09-01]ARJ07845.1 hypothetical protein B7454_00220 [Staphylococcus lugdunensis]ARJ17244.1 hypothetical protein B6N54_11750 [Staphylococcus lugdunensis]ARJ30723.1 hypothetical protein B6N84_12205 [Staphylococcus lugdunensis]EKS23018.1 hypothetical protein HMPREF9308_02002 [Staphylococcus lugdunensis ACS-027-V-Sch2]
MLTKEFAQRVELSEKQVRKIVQHLEERGYQLSKTEYRGREATDFKEDDIELFRDIADKVKQTNSYDLAFEELEQEKDFLQVLVKEDNSKLPTNQNIPQLVEELRTEIQKMREDRQMLGQMMTQVHQQQQELKALQTQLTTKIDDNTASIKAIQTSQEDLANAQKAQTAYTRNELVNDIIKAQPVAPNSNQEDAATKASSLNEPDLESTKDNQTAKQNNTKTVTADNQSKEQSHIETPSTDSDNQSTKAEEQGTTSNVSINADDSITKHSDSESKSTSKTTSEDKSKQLDEDIANSSETSTQSTSEQQSQTANSASSQSSSVKQPAPKEEKKGFFARLFNL